MTRLPGFSRKALVEECEATTVSTIWGHVADSRIHV
jgi:hypothetical protein